MKSSQARDWTCVPCIDRQNLTHCTTREVPCLIFFNQLSDIINFILLSVGYFFSNPINILNFETLVKLCRSINSLSFFNLPFVHSYGRKRKSSILLLSVTQSCLTLWKPTDCSMPGFPVLHCLLEFVQIHVHLVDDATQPSHPLSPLSPPYTIRIHVYTCVYIYIQCMVKLSTEYLISAR